MYDPNWSGTFIIIFWNAAWLLMFGGMIFLILRRYHLRSNAWRLRATPATGRTALEILERRYALDEIDEATFDEMSTRLRNDERGEPVSRGERWGWSESGRAERRSP